MSTTVAAAPPNGNWAGGPRITILLLLGADQKRLIVPADATAGALATELARRYAGDHERWSLVADGQPLNPALTLLDQHVRELQELALVRTDMLRQHPQPPATTQPPETTPSGSRRRKRAPRPAPESKRRAGAGVQERTVAILPARPSAKTRALHVFRALMSPAPEQAEMADGHVDPASLAAEPHRGMRKRVARAQRYTSYEHLLEEAICAAPVHRPIVIGVISGKGGVGKTTTSALLASQLAFLRSEQVLSLDANPDFGMLGALLAPGRGMPIDEMTAEGGPLRNPGLTGTELIKLLAPGPNGLMVCAGPISPDRSKQITSDHYLYAFEVLRRHASILVVDCGTSFTSEPATAVLQVADQLLMISDDTLQSATVAIYAARWLRAQQHELTLAINKREHPGYIAVERLQDEMPDARGLVTVPEDKAAVAQLAGSRLDWREDQGPLGTAIRELACVLAADWDRLSSQPASTPSIDRCRLGGQPVNSNHQGGSDAN